MKAGRSVSWNEVQAMVRAGLTLIRRLTELFREIFEVCCAQLLEK